MQDCLLGEVGRFANPETSSVQQGDPMSVIAPDENSDFVAVLLRRQLAEIDFILQQTETTDIVDEVYPLRGCFTIIRRLSLREREYQTGHGTACTVEFEKDGPVRIITRGEDNRVITLDGRPALVCVLEDLGCDRDLPVDALLQALSKTLAGLSIDAEDVPKRPGMFGTDTLVRHLVGVDLQHRALAVADLVEPSMRLAFCTRNAEAARLDLVRIATEIRAELEGDTAMHMSGALYVSCSGRGGPHFGARHAELQIVRNALGDVPLVGFFAGGEIARNHLYGYTGILTVFTSRD